VRKEALVNGALERLGVVASGLVGSSTRWDSPRFGRRSGRVVMVPGDGWQLVVNERTGGLTWVLKDLHDA
jgi:hypothetical protein